MTFQVSHIYAETQDQIQKWLYTNVNEWLPIFYRFQMPSSKMTGACFAQQTQCRNCQRKGLGTAKVETEVSQKRNYCCLDIKKVTIG